MALFKDNNRFDPEKDLKVVTKHFTHKGKVIKTEEILKARRYFSDGDSYWTSVKREDVVIDVKDPKEAEIYGVSIDVA